MIFNDLETKTFDKYMDKDNPVISKALNQRHLQCVVCIHIPGISWGIYLWSSPHKHLLHKTFLTTPDSIPFSEVNALLNSEMIAQYTMCFHTFYIWLTIKKWLVKFQSEILYQHEWLNNITRVFNAAEWTHFQC